MADHWQMLLTLAFAGYLFLCFGVGVVAGHYLIYRIRG